MAERIKLDYIPAPTAAGFEFGRIQRFMTVPETIAQAARCPSCGAASCQIGCPIGNSIGDFHTLIARGDLEGAANLRFNQTSVLAGVIGSVCPQKDNGLCEDTRNCIAGRGDGESVMIQSIESSMAAWALENELIKPPAPLSHVKQKMSTKRPGQPASIGIVGSGPTALRAAEEAVKLGWQVTIYEKEPVIGGLLSVGIPNFKLNQNLLSGVLDLFRNHPQIEIVANCKVGEHITVEEMASYHDLLIMAHGAQLGKSQDGVTVWHTPHVYQAMRDYLRPQSLKNWGYDSGKIRDMHGKDVVVIGLGYTGVDCFNTANYQGAKSVTVLSGRAPDPHGDMVKNHEYGFNQYILNEIAAAEARGVNFRYGQKVKGYEFISGLGLLRLENNGEEYGMETDAVVLSRGFNIHHIITPENESWATADDYNYKKGQFTQLEDGTPVIILGDGALHSNDRLVVKAAAQAANTFRAYHFDKYPEDNLREAFIGGRKRSFQQISGLVLANG